MISTNKSPASTNRMHTASFKNHRCESLYQYKVWTTAPGKSVDTEGLRARQELHWRWEVSAVSGATVAHHGHRLPRDGVVAKNG